MKTPPQGTPRCREHIQCRAGRFAIYSEVDSYAARATQDREVPSKKPDEVCPTMIKYGGGAL
jgi:hypothetical protein